MEDMYYLKFRDCGKIFVHTANKVTIVLMFCLLLSLRSEGSAWQWKDSRWETNTGRQNVILEAIIELREHGFDIPNGLISYSTWASESGADGCYIHTSYEYNQTKYETTNYEETTYWSKLSPFGDREYLHPKFGWVNKPILIPSIQTRKIPYTLIRIEYKDQIFVTPWLFERGWSNMDEKGQTLWDASWEDSSQYDHYNLYYRYASSLKEAVEFVILRGVAHFIGTAIEADDYAQKTIILLRKQKRGENIPLPDFRLSREGRKHGRSFHTGRIPPPDNDLPPGTFR